jgi:hypothetical protein
MGGEEWLRRRGVVTAAGSGTGVDRASRKDGKEEMTTAGVGGGEEEEEEEGEVEDEEGEAEADSEEGGGCMAETSTSRGEAEGVGTTRVRPSNPMLWSLCLFQHGLQM